MIVQEHLMSETGDSKRIGVKLQKSESNEETGATMDFRRIMTMVGAFYWLVATVVVVPTGCLCTLFLVLYPILGLIYVFRLKISVFNEIEHFLCRMSNDHWVAAGQYSGLSITEYGDDINEIGDSRALFLCNHLGLIDHFCLMTSFWNKKSLPGRYLWVIFNIWKWTPLGIQWTTHGNFFINGGRHRRDAVLDEFRAHLKKLYWKFDFGWVVMYPEGSRLFLIQESEKKFAEKLGIPPFNHCSHPRTGAAHAVLQVCGKSKEDPSCSNVGPQPPMEYVVDCTLGYANGQVPNLGRAMLGEWPGENTNVAVHYAIHKVRPEWSDEAQLKDWLYERYAEKDKLLDAFYRTGAFDAKPRPVAFPWTRTLLVELFWLGLFYAHVQLWMRPLYGLAMRRLCAWLA